MKKTILSPLIKKFVMSITGFVLASFLLVHMLGNLQVFEGPGAINGYAHFLQKQLPWEALWGFRVFLGACFILHLATAYLLAVENKMARPQGYLIKRPQAASMAARTMIYTGTLVILFAVIHLLHYTVLCLNPEFKQLDWVATSGLYQGKVLHDAYAMIVLGFAKPWVAIGYIAAMFLIGFHLSHGVSSMFQSIGFRNETWRYRLNKIAVVYCFVIALGFSITPAAILVSKYTSCKIIPVCKIEKQFECLKAKAGDKAPIFIDYKAICPKACCKAAQCPTAKCPKAADCGAAQCAAMKCPKDAAKCALAPCKCDAECKCSKCKCAPCKCAPCKCAEKPCKCAKKC